MERLEDRRLMSVSLTSVDSTGFASGNDVSEDPDISSNGRFVVFTSRATDLVPADTNAVFDIYLRDTQTGVTQLVSVATTGGGPGNGSSVDPSVSDDGRYVAFSSIASNLVANDVNGLSDVFVRDMFTGTTTLVSLANAVTPIVSANGNSLQPSISDNGRIVAFASDATNLTTNDVTAVRDVFVRNLDTNVTTLVSINSANTAGANAASQLPAVSSNGEFIAYVSDASDVVAGQPGGLGPDVFLRNTTANVSLLISTTNGTTGGLVDVSAPPAISDSARYVAFSSSAADLVAGDVNGVPDIYRRDILENEIVLVSQSSAGLFSNGASIRPDISGDGLFVAFSSVATNLAAADTSPASDIFIRDVDALTTDLVSTPLVAPGNGVSNQPALSADGRVVAFASTSTNLVIEPVEDTNVFLASTPVVSNDTIAPTIRIPSQPSVGPAVGGEVLPFTVVYDDNVLVDTGTLGALDLIVTGPNGFNQPASLFALVSTVGTSATVTYTVPAPGGDLSFEDNGAYTVTIRGQQVADREQNFVATGTTGTFVLDLPASETVLPRPTFIGGSPAVGAATYEFTVVYEERGGIAFNTFGNDDIQVTGPNGFSQNATKLTESPLSATTTAVVYQITAPGGTWDAPDTGVYTASVIAGGVTDVANNAVAAGGIGQFTALGPDLIAVPLRNLRTGAISGVDTQKARVRILNQGTSPTVVPIAVTLYASLDQTLDPADATIGTFIEERSINPDDFREMRVKFTYPTVAEGNYFVLSQVDSASAVVEQSESNNIIASFKQVGLSAPFVDLVPTLIPFAGIRSRLGTNTALVKIRNAGNVTASGDVIVALTAVSDVTPNPQERPVANLPIKINLRPGQSRTFRLPFTFPIEFERGNYNLVATIDSSNIFPERDEVNNRVVSLSEFSFA